MVKSKRPRLVSKIFGEKDILLASVVKDTVKKLGRSGYVALPKELVGKYVLIKVEVLNEKQD